jgi:uncharacterized protein (DUF3084 family)
MNRIKDWFRAVADVGRQRIEINRLNVELLDQRADLNAAAQTVSRRDFTIKHLTAEISDADNIMARQREELLRTEQVLTGIKTFARTTEYLQVKRVLLTMIGER